MTVGGRASLTIGPASRWQLIRCWLGLHPKDGWGASDTIRFTRRVCVRCGRVLQVRDGLTGARYFSTDTLAYDLDVPEKEVEYLFKRLY